MLNLQAKNSVSNSRRLLGYFAGFALLVMFIVTALPVLMLPFVYILPYLQTQPFLVRLMWSAALYAVVWGLWFFVTTRQQQKSVFLLINGWNDKIGATLGMAMFMGSCAFFNANIMGLLVLHTLPTQPYLEHMLIDQVKYQGSRHKSIFLTLHSETDGETYYLTLAKKLFDYPRIEAGNKMILKGQQNVFGVYVDKFEIE